MPKSKNADIRYKVLDTCLRDKNHRYTFDDLHRICNERVNAILDPEEEYSVSTRQIRIDLNYMSSDAGFEAPIVSKKIPGERKHYFTYEDPDFSISQKPLNEEDLANLKSSLFLLQRFGGTHHEEWIHDFALRIEDLPVKKTKDKSTSLPADNQPKEIIVQFDHQDQEGKGDLMIPLYQAIEKKQPLLVTYREFNTEKEILYKISPYLLKQYNRRWFLLCSSEGLSNVTTLPLDRIQKIEFSAHKFAPYSGPGEEPINFFDEIIGVINKPEDKVQTIHLEVHQKLLPYIESKLIHESQKKAKPTDLADWYAIELRLKPNYEFYSVILSHGPKLKIVSPESVKLNVRSMLKEMLDNY